MFGLLFILYFPDFMHIGYSRKIAFSTQLIEFHIKDSNLKYFSLLSSESFNIQLQNFIVSEFNTNLQDFVKSISDHPRAKLENFEELHFFENFTNGTECIIDGIRKPRSSTIEYVCSESGRFLEVFYTHYLLNIIFRFWIQKNRKHANI